MADSKKASKEKKPLGIKDLAKTLGLQEATVRKNLRTMGLKKPGRAYEWDKAGLESVAKKLSASAPTAKAVPAKAKAKTKKAA